MKLVTNAIDTEGVREETLEGQKHLVAPVVAVKSLELNKGYVPAEELAKSTPQWNGVPLPIGHPMDADGRYVSANQSAVLNTSVVGRFLNAQFVPEDESIEGELWINIERAEQIGGAAKEALEMVRNREPLEVSTAYRSIEATPGVYDGKYRERVRADLRPDHLAILPGDLGPGKCSVADGCGTYYGDPSGAADSPEAATSANTEQVVHPAEFSTQEILGVNTASIGSPSRLESGGEGLSPITINMKANVTENARVPTYGQLTTNDWDGRPSMQRYIDSFYANRDEPEPSDTPSTVEGLSDEQREYIAERTLLGNAEADSYAELAFFPVVNPDDNSLNAAALMDVLDHPGEQANISANQRASARSISHELLTEKFKIENVTEHLSTDVNVDDLTEADESESDEETDSSQNTGSPAGGPVGCSQGDTGPARLPDGIEIEADTQADQEALEEELQSNDGRIARALNRFADAVLGEDPTSANEAEEGEEDTEDGETEASEESDETDEEDSEVDSEDDEGGEETPEEEAEKQTDEEDVEGEQSQNVATSGSEGQKVKWSGSGDSTRYGEVVETEGGDIDDDQVLIAVVNPNRSGDDKWTGESVLMKPQSDSNDIQAIEQFPAEPETNMSNNYDDDDLEQIAAQSAFDVDTLRENDGLAAKVAETISLNEEEETDDSAENEEEEEEEEGDEEAEASDEEPDLDPEETSVELGEEDRQKLVDEFTEAVDTRIEAKISPLQEDINEYKEIAANQLEEKKERREEREQEILANSDAYTEDVLETFDDEQFESVYNSVMENAETGTDYGGVPSPDVNSVLDSNEEADEDYSGSAGSMSDYRERMEAGDD